MADRMKTNGTPAQGSWGARGTAGVSFAAALTFDNVGVSIGGRTILTDIDLELEPGEILCLLGESGSGKSTLLRVAAGIQHIEAGEVRINGTLMAGRGHHVPAEKRGVGLMFQDFALFPHMTVLQNAAFGLKDLGRGEANKRARAALARVGLAARADEYPDVLSGGQQQRLALARTFAPRPGIILLDEPFSSLDARLRETVRNETLAILRETRATTLIVTHDPEEAMLLGDRIALLREGCVTQVDPSADIYNRPADINAARFFSTLTEIPALVGTEGIETPLGLVPAGSRPTGRPVIVAVRPVGALDLAVDGQGVPGRIVSKREALGVDLIEVQVEGIESPVHIRRRSDPVLRPGSDIVLRLNAEHVLVFDQE